MWYCVLTNNMLRHTNLKSLLPYRYQLLSISVTICKFQYIHCAINVMGIPSNFQSLSYRHQKEILIKRYSREKIICNIHCIYIGNCYVFKLIYFGVWLSDCLTVKGKNEQYFSYMYEENLVIYNALFKMDGQYAIANQRYCKLVVWLFQQTKRYLPNWGGSDLESDGGNRR